jgi:hypothetical protein
MHTHPFARMASPTLAPIAVACPSCKHLMLFNSIQEGTLLYGHQLNRYSFECGDCGRLVTHIVDEDLEL